MWSAFCPFDQDEGIFSPSFDVVLGLEEDTSRPRNPPLETPRLWTCIPKAPLRIPCPPSPFHHLQAPGIPFDLSFSFVALAESEIRLGSPLVSLLDFVVT